ncbi:hypothetical protein GCM10011518_19600 [Flavobacterium limi]|uniref:Uncharacterized protein n=1 Tax=Flavobacterium limi TaxID=2045105 RepID=A0ABQ1U463_9FLAO|nr:hypothetical protein GCM10011518_19600 [Flavobacterium limi]
MARRQITPMKDSGFHFMFTYYIKFRHLYCLVSISSCSFEKIIACINFYYSLNKEKIAFQVYGRIVAQYDLVNQKLSKSKTMKSLGSNGGANTTII